MLIQTKELLCTRVLPNSTWKAVGLVGWLGLHRCPLVIDIGWYPTVIGKRYQRER